MEKYPKIQTVYMRYMNSKDLMIGKYSKCEFKILEDLLWICTEKINGTNIRITYDGKKVLFKGKTDNASIPATLIEKLQELFPLELMAKAFPDSNNVCLYGEGYGFNINAGKHYLPKKNNFILFDVKIDSWWLMKIDVADVAKKLNIQSVPIIGVWKLPQAVEYVKKGFKSLISYDKDYIAEGLVMEPTIQLFDRKGDRVITKIKHKNF